MSRPALILAIATLGCASQETAIRWDVMPEPSFGIEHAGLTKPCGGVRGMARVGVSGTPATSWGESRWSIRPAGGFRVGGDLFGELGMGAHIAPDWSSGTWAELVPFVRFGWRWVWMEVNHHASNAGRDDHGEHPRRPGLGVALGLSWRW